MGAKQSKRTISSKDAEQFGNVGVGKRGQAITGGGGKKAAPKGRPANTQAISDVDMPEVEAALGKLLLFSKIDPILQRKVVQGMWERDVDAGEHPATRFNYSHTNHNPL